MTLELYVKFCVDSYQKRGFHKISRVVGFSIACHIYTLHCMMSSLRYYTCIGIYTLRCMMSSLRYYTCIGIYTLRCMMSSLRYYTCIGIYTLRCMMSSLRYYACIGIYTLHHMMSHCPFHLYRGDGKVGTTKFKALVCDDTLR